MRSVYMHAMCCMHTVSQQRTTISQQQTTSRQQADNNRQQADNNRQQADNNQQQHRIKFCLRLRSLKFYIIAH